MLFFVLLSEANPKWWRRKAKNESDQGRTKGDVGVELSQKEEEQETRKKKAKAKNINL